MDPLVAAVAAAVLPPGARVAAASPGVAGVLAAAGLRAAHTPLAQLPDGTADALALLGDELSHAGDVAEVLVADAARALRPGGLLVASAPGTVWASATAARASAQPARPPARTFSAAALAETLGHAGFEVEARYAPGAAARLAGRPAAFDPRLDREPGLLDAAERVVAVARRYHDEAHRSRSFFASLPRKVVAAAVVCRDHGGRLLVVHDRYRRHWTIPGGVVDADECPRAGAAREAYEETGLRVEAGALLGVFSATWPDRLVFVFDARPAGGQELAGTPVHPHEIDDVRWLAVGDALARLAPHVAEQVRRSLEAPGGIWRQ